MSFFLQTPQLKFVSSLELLFLNYLDPLFYIFPTNSCYQLRFQISYQIKLFTFFKNPSLTKHSLPRTLLNYHSLFFSILFNLHHIPRILTLNDPRIEQNLVLYHPAKSPISLLLSACILAS